MFGKRLSLRKLKAMVGREVGRSDWFAIAQDRIDAFAACTEDRQWIHVDPERAARSPLGGTVAHGFLLLSLVPFFNCQNEVFTGRFRMAVNYGLNRVRFPHPVPAGCRVRNRAVLKSIEKRGFRKVLVTVENTLEVEGADKPAMVADVLALIFL
ncbi:MAG: MaoC family dehydratase [Candidatus Aminicenantes bacterium]|nr:MaoC family dehydratase [Candidatus Aminicenantes bacterium]